MSAQADARAVPSTVWALIALLAISAVISLLFPAGRGVISLVSIVLYAVLAYFLVKGAKAAWIILLVLIVLSTLLVVLGAVAITASPEAAAAASAAAPSWFIWVGLAFAVAEIALLLAKPTRAHVSL